MVRLSVLAMTLNLYSNVSLADEVQVSSLQSGQCWFRLEGEELKLSSFKEKLALQLELSSIEEVALNQVLKKEAIKEIDKDSELKYSLLGISLQCSGNGVSFIVKNKVEEAAFCVWLKYDKESLVAQSVGHLEEQESTSVSCDGYVEKEVLVGLKSEGDEKLFEREGLLGQIKEVQKISKNLYRLHLVDSQKGKEEEFIKRLKESKEFKYVELNLFQHHVGEFERLK